MTLILSVSAHTAVYAADAIRQPRRISSKAQAEDIRVDAERGVRRLVAGDPKAEPLLPTTFVNLDLQDPHQQPQQQTTLAQAQAAYRDLDD